MEYENIKKLMEDMSNLKLTSVKIELPDGTKIKMEKDIQQVVTSAENPIITSTEIANVKEETQQQNIDKNIKIIKSPMVGTFYSKPSPTSEPFVEVGKQVKKGDTVCIIEAMKLMNEIDSEFNGTIKEILVQDGEPVDYGKELFIIE